MLSNYDPKALIPTTLHASAMDFTNTKTPDTDTETPPQTQPLRSFSFRTHHRHHIRLRCPPSSPPHTVAIYKECLRNHAAGLGGYALDGCGEFMPPAAAAALDPTSLKCAACGCHRNFHRRHNPDDSSTTTAPLFVNFHHSSPSDQLSPSPPPPMLLDLGGGSSPPSDHHQTSAKPESDPSGRKRRHRTKFSQDQKEKMYEFSEKMGWKMRKSDEKMVAEFCNEIGVRRGVLKVWMHNNKNTINGGSSYVNYKKNESTNNANYNIDSKIGIHDSDHHVHGLNINGSSSSS